MFTDSIYERTTGRRFKISDATLYTNSRIERLNVDKKSKTKDGYLDFEVLVPEEYRFVGTIFEEYSVYEEGDTALNVEYGGIYNYEDGVYSLKFQLVPRDTGRYFFVFGAIVSIFDRHPTLSRNVIEFEGKCPRAGVAFFTHVNEGDDNNIYLLQYSPIEFYNYDLYTFRPERFYDNGGYCFVVVE